MFIDYALPVGQVRLLIADVDGPENLIFADEQIEGFIALNVGSIRRAAADALDAIASSESLVSKVIKTQDLSTDGTKVAADLRVHAERLRSQAEDDDFAFDVVDFNPNQWPPEGTRWVDGL